MLKKILSIIFVGFFVFGGFVQPAQAAGACTMQVAKQLADGTQTEFSSGAVDINPGETVIVRVQNATEDGQILDTLNRANYYLVWNDKYFVVNNNQSSETGTYTFVFNKSLNDGPNPFSSNNLDKPDHIEFGRTNSLIIGSSVDLYCASPGQVTYKYAQNETCGITHNVTRKPNGTGFNVAVRANTTDLVPGKGYYLRLFAAGRFHINTGFTVNGPDVIFSEGNNNIGFSNFDNGFSGKTENLYITDGGATMCEQSVFFDPNAPIVDPTNPELIPEVPGLNRISAFSLCGQLPPGSEQREACEACESVNVTEDTPRDAEGNPNPTGIYSAIGCIRVDQKGFLRQAIRILLSVSGLIALLSILAGAFLLSTSQGDSNQVKKARELITAAVSGLLFIIFSTMILDFIGVQILRIPGLS